MFTVTSWHLSNEMCKVQSPNQSGNGKGFHLICLLVSKKELEQSHFKNAEVVRILWCGNSQRTGTFPLIRLIRVLSLMLVWRMHLRELGYESLTRFLRLEAFSSYACMIVFLWGRCLRVVVFPATVSVLCVECRASPSTIYLGSVSLLFIFGLRCGLLIPIYLAKAKVWANGFMIIVTATVCIIVAFLGAWFFLLLFGSYGNTVIRLYFIISHSLWISTTFV